MYINNTFITLYFAVLSDTDYSYRWQGNRKVDRHSSHHNTDYIDNGKKVSPESER